MAHPVSRSKTQAAHEQKTEDNSQLRSSAKRYLSVVPGLRVFFGTLLRVFDLRLVIVKNSAHILNRLPLARIDLRRAAPLLDFDAKSAPERLKAEG